MKQTHTAISIAGLRLSLLMLFPGDGIAISMCTKPAATTHNRLLVRTETGPQK